MSADAIVGVTLALKERLEQALTKAGVPGTVFVGPLDDADASGAKLILFLYRIVPSATLRNREHRVPTGIPQPLVHVFRNALPLDLYFLVTVGTTPGSSEEGPLQALGVAMQAMQVMPDLLPKPPAAGNAVGHEAVHVTLEPLTTEEASRIWALFPAVNYRTSIAYLATPVWIDPPQAAPEAKPVVQDELRAGVATTEAAP